MSNDQQRSNLIRRQAQDMVQRLRVTLANTDPQAAPLLDRLTPQAAPQAVVNEVHAMLCDRLGVKADASNLVNHPWDKSGWAKNRR